MQFSRFFRDRKGGVAPLLALGLVPLVGAVGAAVDYSRASNVRAAMQAAADATALMLAKTASGLTAAQMQQNATSYSPPISTIPKHKACRSRRAIPPGRPALACRSTEPPR